MCGKVSEDAEGGQWSNNPIFNLKHNAFFNENSIYPLWVRRLSLCNDIEIFQN